MQGRGSEEATFEILAPRPEDQRPDCCLGPQNPLPDGCAALCHALSERLTATGNYLGALQRLLEIGYRRGQPLPAEILEKAGCEVARAGELIHQFRQMLATHTKT